MAAGKWGTRRGRPFQLLLVIVVGVGVGVAIGGVPNGSRDEPLIAAATTTTMITTAPGPAPTPAPRPPSDVEVVALNASGVGGAAGRVGSRLQAAGYRVLPPAVNSRRQAVGSVVYRPTFERDAAAVASLLGLGPEVVRPADAAPGDGQGGPADVIVLVGDDLARRS
ncbi:MAG: LytR C-terminal domain-containing protein [Actinomycetota bacterium]|nr:LytR C-terminal domain-containing protein [Actinomycetota bacterium]